MEQFIVFTGRNLKNYFKDKGAVFFSLLSMIIVICLMTFFLGDMNIESIKNLLLQFPGRDAVADEKNAELLVFVWTCAGIISINAVTVTMAVYSVMIKDRASGRINAIYTSPMSRTAIAGGYIASSFIASVCVCVLTLFAIELIGVQKGMTFFPAVIHIRLFGMIAMNSFTYAAFMYLMVLLAKTEGAWSGMGTVIGTLVGFLGGIYIPVGALSETVGSIIKCTPVIYGTAMFRTVMTEDILAKTFQGLPDEVIAEYCDVMGISLKLFGKEIGTPEEWLILLLCGIIFLITGVAFLKYSRKTDR
ncbi:MAG: ABC transporter permease [Lachnospiraceae bacterium]|nr:ABC transporter permease [Lachnospiraceae bacterium]